MNKQPLQRRAGFPFLRGGSILLVIDLVLWGSMYALSLLLQLGGTTFTPLVAAPLSLVIMLVFLLGFPLAFIGVLLLLIGLGFMFSPVHSRGSKLIFSGLLTLLVGLLAWVIPPLVVTPGSGDTLWAWMAGLTALFVGIPLPLLGTILLLKGLFLVMRSRLWSVSGQ
jgi:hypothetical protein